MIWWRCSTSPYVSIISTTLLECFCFDSLRILLFFVIVSKTAALSVMDKRDEWIKHITRCEPHAASASKIQQALTRKSTIRQKPLNDVIAIFMIDKWTWQICIKDTIEDLILLSIMTMFNQTLYHTTSIWMSGQLFNTTGHFIDNDIKCIHEWGGHDLILFFSSFSFKTNCRCLGNKLVYLGYRSLYDMISIVIMYEEPHLALDGCNNVCNILLVKCIQCLLNESASEVYESKMQKRSKINVRWWSWKVHMFYTNSSNINI